MSRRESVLVLGPEDRTQELTGRLVLVNFRGIRVGDLQAALELQETASLPLRAALITSPNDFEDLEPGLQQLSKRSSEGNLDFIAIGREPEAGEIQALRRAGVRTRLWEPFTDEELRFLVNRAHHRMLHLEPRDEERVPATLLARVCTKTGERTAIVYNLSAGGAFLVTPRPTLRGGTLRLSLTLPTGEASVDAEVAWNNVPGNLRKSNAPVGMGVQFVDLEPDVLEALRGYVKERAASYRL